MMVVHRRAAAPARRTEHAVAISACSPIRSSSWHETIAGSLFPHTPSPGANDTTTQLGALIEGGSPCYRVWQHGSPSRVLRYARLVAPRWRLGEG